MANYRALLKIIKSEASHVINAYPVIANGLDVIPEGGIPLVLGDKQIGNINLANSVAVTSHFVAAVGNPFGKLGKGHLVV